MGLLFPLYVVLILGDRVAWDWSWALVAVLAASYLGLKSFASLVQASPSPAILSSLPFGRL